MYIYSYLNYICCVHLLRLQHKIFLCQAQIELFFALYLLYFVLYQLPYLQLQHYSHSRKQHFIYLFFTFKISTFSSCNIGFTGFIGWVSTFLCTIYCVRNCIYKKDKFNIKKGHFRLHFDILVESYWWKILNLNKKYH